MSEIKIYKLATGGRTGAEILTKIAQIDALIDMLITTGMASVQNGNIVEYEVDTGQTEQRVEYSTVAQVVNGIRAYERLRVYYQNKLTGSAMRLVDYKNYTNR